MNYKSGIHSISFTAPMQFFPEEELPDETVIALLGRMVDFPIGTLMYWTVGSLNEDTLWYDTSRAHFFSGTIEEVLDLYAEHLNKIWRETQRKRQVAQYWKQVRLRKQTA
jgi:hypothetical protein